MLALNANTSLFPPSRSPPSHGPQPPCRTRTRTRTKRQQQQQDRRRRRQHPPPSRAPASSFRAQTSKGSTRCSQTTRAGKSVLLPSSTSTPALTSSRASLVLSTTLLPLLLPVFLRVFLNSSPCSLPSLNTTNSKAPRLAPRSMPSPCRTSLSRRLRSRPCNPYALLICFFPSFLPSFCSFLPSFCSSSPLYFAS